MSAVSIPDKRNVCSEERPQGEAGVGGGEGAGGEGGVLLAGKREQQLFLLPAKNSWTLYKRQFTFIIDFFC